MHTRLGRCRMRSTLTVNSLKSFQSRSLPNSVLEEGRQFDNRRTKVFDAFCLHLRHGCFWSRNTALPIASAAGQQQGFAAIGVEENLRVVRVPGQPHPEHICSSAQVLNRQAGVVPDNGIAAIGAHHLGRTHLQRTWK
jgi:hypothetical protein